MINLKYSIQAFHSLVALTMLGAIKTVGLHIQGLTSTIDISPIDILVKSQRLRNN